MSLSAATDLAYYGGVRSIVYEGDLPFDVVEDGELGWGSSGEWILWTEYGCLQGPKYVEVANPGGVMFGIEDNLDPDPIQVAAEEARYQARVERHERLIVEREAARSDTLHDDAGEVRRPPYPRRRGQETIPPFWKAEIERRREKFFAKLNAAARSGEVRFFGNPVKGLFVLEPADVGAATEARRLSHGMVA